MQPKHERLIIVNLLFKKKKKEGLRLAGHGRQKDKLRLPYALMTVDKHTHTHTRNTHVNTAVCELFNP